MVDRFFAACPPPHPIEKINFNKKNNEQKRAGVSFFIDFFEKLISSKGNEFGGSGGRSPPSKRGGLGAEPPARSF